MDEPYEPYKRVEQDSTERCQATNKFGQCNLNRAPESNYCIMHGGAGVQRRVDVKNYRNTIVQSRIQEYLNAPDALHSLYEEIAILRLSLDQVLNKLYRQGTTPEEQEIELHLRLPGMIELIDKIAKIVPVSQKLETHYSKTVGKSELLSFAGDIVKIISDYIDDPETLREVSDAILAKLQ